MIKTEKVEVVEIILERAEGPIHECGNKVVCGNWAHAQTELRLMSFTAPEPGHGYDKVDFKVVWDDCETYEGRYDLQNTGLNDSGERLQEQVRNMLLFWSNQRQPEWTKEKDNEKHWTDMQERHIEEGYKEYAEKFLETHEV